jgi:hypothetical protein
MSKMNIAWWGRGVRARITKASHLGNKSISEKQTREGRLQVAESLKLAEESDRHPLKLVS